MLFNYLILVLPVFSFVRGANILAIIPTPSYSHQVAFFDLWSELSLRGHQVTVITTDPQKNEKLTNLTEVDMKWTYSFFVNISKEAETISNMWNTHSWIHRVARTVTEAQLSDPQVQDLIHNRNKKFDVLLLESLYPEFLGFAEIYQCPTILVSSLDALEILHHKIGNTAHPVLYPELGAVFHYPLNFKERVTSTIYSLYTSAFYKYVSFPERDELMQEMFRTTATVHELLDNVDMLFLTVNPILNTVRAIGPSTITIGGLRKMTAKPLPKDLSRFLDSATEGFVYFSLGSNVKSKDLRKDSLKAIAEALSELPYKVLWKFEANEETMPYKAKNVKLIQWAPQVSILAHPNIKVFVTQGGLQSMEEALLNEVPSVVIPFFGDQVQNARLMTNKGFAVAVGRHPHINKDELKNAILEVIRNQKYRNTAKEIKRLMQDTPMTSLEKAVWWTEYVIRNKGAKHLRNPAADIPLYQYYLLDVIVFLIVVLLVVLSSFIYLLKKTYYVVKYLKISVAKNKKSQ